MSYWHLGHFSLTPLKQHCVRRTDTHELDVFRAQNALVSHAMGSPLRKGRYLLGRRVMRLSRLQQGRLTLHLYIDEFTILIDVGSNARAFSRPRLM